MLCTSGMYIRHTEAYYDKKDQTYQVVKFPQTGKPHMCEKR